MRRFNQMSRDIKQVKLKEMKKSKSELKKTVNTVYI